MGRIGREDRISLGIGVAGQLPEEGQIGVRGVGSIGQLARILAVLGVVQVERSPHVGQRPVQRRQLGVVRGAGELRHHHGCQDRQDDDHDQQLHQGKALLASSVAIQLPMDHGTLHSGQ